MRDLVGCDLPHLCIDYLIVGPSEAADDSVDPTALLVEQQKSGKQNLKLNRNYTDLHNRKEQRYSFTIGVYKSLTIYH